jgi:hypothetical protein
MLPLPPLLLLLLLSRLLLLLSSLSILVLSFDDDEEEAFSASSLLTMARRHFNAHAEPSAEAHPWSPHSSVHCPFKLEAQALRRPGLSSRLWVSTC